ncbi:5-hydroxytryptamine receptor 1-like [Topomyia yanbarensis]|uniref:5-hydroxytryptamine receptor 1-like n=1 Tax=Topomyia yanbarensis TaxID=2498891 RepID=UPI00273C78C7|nr:5-hydroxytryptamine receptor 1-like [Topomyia yanbarensis]XP_058813097.1 5-hydroxytryptamine receptor 1-like [Topomyia yanbarensis]XP_058813098.1 5-hydroxytryptamine receptor 1-like [Topomyia yanbarensis]XP_058813099.1 5-hydroxytryptamine receptor 1-like [Topomyia yanbarensis]
MDPTVLPLLSTLIAPSIPATIAAASQTIVIAAAGNATATTVAAILNATVLPDFLEYLVNGSTVHASAQPALADHLAPANLTQPSAASTSSLFEPSTESTFPNQSSNHVVSFQTIIISIILLAVIFATIVGNVLVCVAVCLVRKLRRPCNYLLVSLAISDLCVALLVMPTALLYEVLEEWKFGTVFCDIWVSFDVLSCTASILNLCAISVDRYWAITKPLEYGVKRTPRRMILVIVLVWLVAACISLPPLLILGNEHMTNGHPSCSVCQNFFYQIYATLGSFYIPLAVMLFVYCQIFRAARRIVMEEKRAQTRLETAINGNATPEKKLTPCGKVLVSTPHHKRLRFQLAKERKASTTLGIIMSAFVICWLPFFILALVRPFLGDDHPTLSSLFLWLGYANSLLNPIIYATLNRDFRKPFQEILYFRCSNLNSMMREDFYHSQYGEPCSQRFVITNDGGARESFL